MDMKNDEQESSVPFTTVPRKALRKAAYTSKLKNSSKETNIKAENIKRRKPSPAKKQYSSVKCMQPTSDKGYTCVDEETNQNVWRGTVPANLSQEECEKHKQEVKQQIRSTRKGYMKYGKLTCREINKDLHRDLYGIQDVLMRAKYQGPALPDDTKPSAENIGLLVQKGRTVGIDAYRISRQLGSFCYSNFIFVNVVNQKRPLVISQQLHCVKYFCSQTPGRAQYFDEEARQELNTKTLAFVVVYATVGFKVHVSSTVDHMCTIFLFRASLEEPWVALYMDPNLKSSSWSSPLGLLFNARSHKIQDYAGGIDRPLARYIMVAVRRVCDVRSIKYFGGITVNDVINPSKGETGICFLAPCLNIALLAKLKRSHDMHNGQEAVEIFVRGVNDAYKHFNTREILYDFLAGYEAPEIWGYAF